MNLKKALGGAATGLMLVLLATGCSQPTAPASSPSSVAVEAMNRGVSAMGQYNYEEAVKAFEQALQAAPELVEAKINLAIARFNRSRKEDHDLEQAGELLDAVIRQNATNTHAWYFKGIVLQHVGESEAAVGCFEKVVQQRPDDGVAWYLLGLCKQRLGQKSENELLHAVTLRPYLASAYYRLWQAAQADGQTEKAKSYLDIFKQLRENPLAETIELPQYNQMGDLALARPLPSQTTPPITPVTYTAQPARQLFATPQSRLPGVSAASSPQTTVAPEPWFGGAGIADFNQDGRLDLVMSSTDNGGAGRLVLLTGQPNGELAEATAGSGLETVRGARACALGDFDNDETVDLFVAGTGTNYLFRGQGNGTFVDVSGPTGIGGRTAGTRSGLFLDADHDGDLDLFVCNAAPAGNQLWNNNADGTFTNIAVTAGLACPDRTTVMVLPGDLDGDRDMDLVLLFEGQPAKVFLNDLLGKYREADLNGVQIQGDLGGALQDFNGDGHLDVLALGGNPARLRLFLGDGHAHFHADPALAQTADAAASWGPLRGLRVVDLDLDGDLDIVVFSTGVQVLLNNGAGRFVLQPQFWKSPEPNRWAGAEVIDFNGDYVADLLRLEGGPARRVMLLPGALTPPSTALSITPTGLRGRDKRTRSPASGYGVAMTVRAGLREQSRVFTGQAGGFNQSPLPVVFGLGGARQADYAHLLWPDGVAQVETAMAAGQHFKVAELQRKISSCPVLFAWNGTRFEFLTDFAGVGGLGYYVAPGESAPPQVLEHLKIEPQQLQLRDGAYAVRITEPMEEAAYIDQLELIVVDQARDCLVYPDERLAIRGLPPTHELLVVNRPLWAQRATDPAGRDCTAKIARVDRVYAYAPQLDRRFFGFCQPHTLELDFGDQLADPGSNPRLFLFINGYLEYPYSQTVYAASQAHVGWEPIRIEHRLPDGRWQTIVPDAGAPGGLARTMTVDLTGLVSGPDCRLRLTSNLEIYYDQIFLGRPLNPDEVKLHTLPVASAELRRAGFAREYSPDGRLPLLYDYDLTDATAPFHMLRGAYTRYGPVRELLAAFDDQYVILGSGDEIAVKFDGSRLPALPAGLTRSFILVSHAYCKDMDLYTATPQTLEPLPFRAMSRYPYPPTEPYPDTAAHRRTRATYHTRLVE